VKIYFGRLKPLGGKLRVVLWQLPPRFGKDVGRLEEFLRELRAYKVLHAFEFRDESWFSEDVYAVLKRARAAVCEADGKHATPGRPDTAPFAYVRRHGPGSYSAARVRRDASHVRNLPGRKKEVFVFYNNDPKGHAVRNAESLKKSLSKT
jgi:uncharacterized protein YecE (DUF72 family)